FTIAVNDLDWDQLNGVARMIFLIGDAGPHMDYTQTIRYHDTAQNATRKGIQVFSIGCSGIDQNEVSEFTEMANLTGGSFEFLTYKMDIEQDGETKTLLITGDKASIAEPEALGEKEWRRGAEELKSKGKVRSADKKESFSYKDSASGEEIEADADDLTNAHSTQTMENNLDLVIQRQIQIQAEMQGAKYEKSELNVGVKEKTEVKKRNPWYVNVVNWFKSLF
ncbi:hypothetical protein KKB99_01600, partial [bacterium]|nr:hypothetical protein [bacterium]MBU1024681.1 hypothetical protein [bacterium]